MLNVTAGRECERERDRAQTKYLRSDSENATHNQVVFLWFSVGIPVLLKGDLLWY